MRNYVKRGAVSNRIQYARLRESIWNLVYSYDKEGVVLHDNDIQFIAMTEALKQNLPDFQVYIHIVNTHRKKYLQEYNNNIYKYLLVFL